MIPMGPFPSEIFYDTSSEIQLLKMGTAKKKSPLSRSRDALYHITYNSEDVDAP